MFRAAARSASRAIPRALARGPGARRLASTASPADRPRSWKSSGLRWGLVAAAIYWYNTSPIFADELPDPVMVPAPPAFSESDLPTVDALVEEKRKQAGEKAAAEAPAREQAVKGPAEAAASESSSEALDEEESQEGAFNPETGEINWDCPCLGGMAHGPCGEDFKAAFSCFVHSNDEPKGMDCIDKFQDMQECFRKHPEIYAAELDDEESSDDEEGGSKAPATEQDAAQGNSVTSPPKGDSSGKESTDAKLNERPPSAPREDAKASGKAQTASNAQKETQSEVDRDTTASNKLGKDSPDSRPTKNAPWQDARPTNEEAQAPDDAKKESKSEADREGMAGHRPDKDSPVSRPTKNAPWQDARNSNGEAPTPGEAQRESKSESSKGTTASG